jgi:hypothetical protein
MTLVKRTVEGVVVPNERVVHRYRESKERNWLRGACASIDRSLNTKEVEHDWLKEWRSKNGHTKQKA